jgi:membrane fusion protein (multidrug efflux system)
MAMMAWLRPINPVRREVMDGSQFVGPAGPRAGTSAGKRHRAWPLRQLLIGLAAFLVLIGIAAYGRYYWDVGRFLVSTDDAYVQAHSVIISPQVSGYIVAVPVNDNQRVHAGEVLAHIDPRDYQTALAAARATVAAAQASIDNLQQQIAEQKLQVEEARAGVSADRAALTFARQQNARYARLARTGAGAMQDSQQWQSTILQREAEVARDTAAVGVARKQINVLGTALAKAKATLAQQQAALHQAELNLGYTTITAPVDGTVADRTLRVGQYVEAGTQLMAVVPLHAVYVTANYKETQLTDVHSGQPVSIDVDTFPGETVYGVVNSIAPASGDEFALLPPDNATGNFVKIVQRIPVKITLDPHDPLAGRLRPGMSVEPTIDTRHE